jgi:hypothetical protein
MANRIANNASKTAGSMIRVDSELEWKYTYFTAEKKWFAFCERLQIALQSSSLEELKQDMIECVDNLFTELAKTGELKGFLEKHGWVLKQPLPSKQAKSTVDMSVRFERVEQRDLQEALH